MNSTKLSTNILVSDPALSKAAKRAKGSLVSLDGLDCSNVIMANRAIKEGVQLPARVAQQLEYLAARCEEALEES